ncbi:MAG: hypothetical protein LUD17_00160 [Bacteroidales bacterium]|nr:hypothetical protein [Bacteroidales bacterium]
MTQMTLTIKDPKDANLIRKLLAKFDSVTISVIPKKRKSAYEEAMEDIEKGRVTEYPDAETYFKAIGVK